MVDTLQSGTESEAKRTESANGGPSGRAVMSNLFDFISNQCQQQQQQQSKSTVPQLNFSPTHSLLQRHRLMKIKSEPFLLHGQGAERIDVDEENNVSAGLESNKPNGWPVKSEEEREQVEVEGEGEGAEEEDEEEEEGAVVLSSAQANFDMPIPMPMPPVLNMQYICETASRLLFLSVHWLKSVPALKLRPNSQQEAVLKQRWCELFALGLVQCSGQFCLSSMLSAMNTHLRTCAALGQLKMEKFEEVREQILALQTLLNRANELRLTSVEFGLLKILVFSADGEGGTSAESAVRLKRLQRRACRQLYDEVRGSSVGVEGADSSPVERYSQLLLLLPTMRSFNKQVLVELFFSGLIGNLQIENVLPFILGMDVLQVFGNSSSADPDQSPS